MNVEDVCNYSAKENKLNIKLNMIFMKGDLKNFHVIFFLVQFSLFRFANSLKYNSQFNKCICKSDLKIRFYTCIVSHIIL